MTVFFRKNVSPAFKGTALVVLLSAGTFLTSCIKDEPLNAECDMEEAFIHTNAPLDLFYNASDTLVRVPYSDNTVVFSVRRQADLTRLAPRFRLTEGATISPENGSEHDFSQGPVTYRVTSEDGQWHRDYEVRFNHVVKMENTTVNFDFEHFNLEAKENRYYEWHNLLEDGTLGNDWATGNPGFRLSKSSAQPEEYPTVPMQEGYDGYGVQLTTRDTGGFGVMVNMRLAAGNLFLGSFDVTQALKDAMRATAFGVPFDKQPRKFSGYYKYTPGPKFQDKQGKEVAGREDRAAIYAVLYRNHDAEGNAVTLFGDNVKSSDLIVAIADLGPVGPTPEWTAFELTFDYLQEVDLDLLANRGYNLAVVASSSEEGDKFEGAIGSTLCVDKFSIVCEEEIQP